MVSVDWRYEYSRVLVEKLRKLKKKDGFQHKVLMKKINSVKENIKINPDHFKNLKHDLSEYKRVHVDNSFVLVFKIGKKERMVRFVDYDHHDKIYS